MKNRTPRTTISYLLTKFQVSTISDVCDRLISIYNIELNDLDIDDSNIKDGRKEWQPPTLEEYFEHYKDAKTYWMHIKINPFIDLSIWGRPDGSVSVSIKSKDEKVKASIFNIFERDLEKSKIDPIIFIGHGHDKQWQELQNFLQSEGFVVKAYEIGPKSGYDIKYILEKMLDESSIAFLVLTRELVLTEKNNKTSKYYPRQNVIHELGLFQGRLGFGKAIQLVEHGVEKFSNIDGTQIIPFNKGNIRETFGAVIATINREFPPRNRCL